LLAEKKQKRAALRPQPPTQREAAPPYTTARVMRPDGTRALELCVAHPAWATAEDCKTKMSPTSVRISDAAGRFALDLPYAALDEGIAVPFARPEGVVCKFRKVKGAPRCAAYSGVCVCVALACLLCL
jgi:hypothetical protein